MTYAVNGENKAKNGVVLLCLVQDNDVMAKLV